MSRDVAGLSGLPQERGLAARANAGLAALIIATAFALPLAFLPAIDDAFALPKVAVLQLAAFGGAGLLLLFVVAGGRLTSGRSPLVDVPLFVFTVLSLASTVLSVDVRQSVFGEPYQYQGLVTTLAFVGSFYASRLALGDLVRFRYLLWAIVASGAGNAIYAIAQTIGFDPFWSAGRLDERVGAAFGQPNDLAAFLLIAISAAYGLWGGADHRARVTLLAISGTCVVALVFTGSRGGYLGLGVLALIVGSAVIRNAGFRPIAAATGAALAVLIAVSLVPIGGDAVASVADRIGSKIVHRDRSIQSHLDVWAVGVAIARDHPILGTGPETYPIVFPDYRDRILPADRARILAPFRPESPHNEVIGVADGSGLPAAFAYVVFLCGSTAIVIRSLRSGDDPHRHAAAACLLILLTHVVTTFFKTPDTTTSWLFFVISGAGLAVLTIEAHPAHGLGRVRRRPSGYTAAP
jgi:O-antigen ligase